MSTSEIVESEHIKVVGSREGESGMEEQPTYYCSETVIIHQGVKCYAFSVHSHGKDHPNWEYQFPYLLPGIICTICCPVNKWKEFKEQMGILGWIHDKE